MAEEGMAEAAPTVEGGSGSAVAGVEEAGVEEAVEAAEGEIIDTMVGANFFAFSKKAFSSERVWPCGVVVVKQHMPWDGLNGGRTRCWRIRERGTS
jgi:hypothetical protein